LKSIPHQLRSNYDSLLIKGVHAREHAYYRKWLRYYLDYCQKYGLDESDKGSLSPFINKLKEKKQSDKQQQQAVKAITAYYELASANKEKWNTFKDRYEEISRKKDKPKLVNADWRSIYYALESEIKVRHYSEATLRSYRGWTRKFQGFTKSKDPQLLSDTDVKAFLSDLAVNQGVAASTQNQAFNSLLFVFRHVLKNEFGAMQGVVRAKTKPYIPTVLSREEIDAILSRLAYPYDLVVRLLYGCGLRLFECLNLRVQDLNFDTLIATVHNGKGKKDRTVPLPEKIVPELKEHLNSVIITHQQDLKSGYAGTFLPNLLEKKYQNAAIDLNWQWFFPAKTLTLVPETKVYKRYHLHKSHVQKAIKKAVRVAKISKRASAHTFRHSFASHLLQANYDIRTIQELLGHSDVRTTMIYTHTIKSQTIKEAKSPLDF